MAITFDSMTLAEYHPPHASHPGRAVIRCLTSADSEYNTDGFALNLTKLMASPQLGCFTPAWIKQVELKTREGYIAEWTPAAVPTVANAGNIMLFASGGTEATDETPFEEKTWDLIIDMGFVGA